MAINRWFSLSCLLSRTLQVYYESSAERVKLFNRFFCCFELHWRHWFVFFLSIWKCVCTESWGVTYFLKWTSSEFIRLLTLKWKLILRYQVWCAFFYILRDILLHDNKKIRSTSRIWKFPLDYKFTQATMMFIIIIVLNIIHNNNHIKVLLTTDKNDKKEMHNAMSMTQS